MEKRTPEKIIYGWIAQEKNIKLTFVAAMLTGLIAHIYIFANKLPNADDVGHINAYGQGARMGRWFLEIMGETVQQLVGNYSMPFFNGILLVFLLALAACQLVAVLEIRDSVCCMFIGALFVCFPSITDTMIFMFTTPFYGVAILMSVLAAKYIIEGGIKSILGTFLLLLSIATYQAYFPLCIAILVAKSIKNIKEEGSVKETIRYAVYSGGGMVCYLLSVKIAQWIFRVEMATYRGANQIGDKIAEQGIVKAVKMAYQALVQMMTTGYLGLTEYRILRVIFAVFIMAAVALLVKKIWCLVKEKEYFRAIWLGILAVFYPIGVFGIYLSGAGNDIYALMMFPTVMLYVLPVILVDDENHKEKWKYQQISSALNYSFCFMMIGVIVLYCRFSNEYYLWMQMDYNQTSSYFTTLIANIKECDGYQENDEVVLVGNRVDDATVTGTGNFQDITMGDSSGYLTKVYSYRDFIRYYCGFNRINEEMEEEVITWQEVKEMPKYPNEGSIRKVRGVIVVKLQETAEKE